MRLSEIMGLPVIGIREGSVLTKITGWLMAASEPRAACLLTESECWYENARALAFDAVTGIANAVIIRDGTGIASLRDRADLAEAVEACNLGVGERVYTPSGENLGAVADIDISDRGSVNFLVLDSGAVISARSILSCGQAYIVSRPDSQAYLAQDDAICVSSCVSNAIRIKKIRP